MLAAAVRRDGCRREAARSDGRSATGVTPHWYGSAEVLQHRADTKPLVSCSEKLARQERLRSYSALRRPTRPCSTRAARVRVSGRSFTRHGLFLRRAGAAYVRPPPRAERTPLANVPENVVIVRPMHVL
jgi:hypothetical protein